MRKPLSLALSLLGLFDSLYLLWVYTSPSRPMVCLGTGCDVVRSSSYAHLWGLPMPVFGVAAYLTLAVLILAATMMAPPLSRSLEYGVALVSGGGFLFSLYLTYLEGFVIHAWCAWCVVSALVVTGIFALTIIDLLRPEPPFDPARALNQVRAQFALCLLGLIVGAPAFLWLSGRGELPPVQAATPQALAERLVRPDSHVAGNPDAKVTIVEFGDFQCPMCGQAEESAREMRQKYGNQIKFVFRQFPLAAIHSWAEKAAEASECAAEQGKFWEAVDKLYAEQKDLSEPALKRYATELGLDQNRFSQCLDSGATAERVRRDLEDGRALGLNATPTFFVGHKMILGAIAPDLFSKLIDSELASASGAGTTFAQNVTPPAAGQPGRQASAAGDPLPKPKSTHSKTDPDSSSGMGLLGGASDGGAFTKFQTSTPGCSEDEAKQKQPTLISPAQTRQLFESSPKPLFVDVRSAQEFSAGHIPGARNIPLESFSQKWDSLPKNQTIVLYESGRASGDICAASRAAGRTLLSNGFPFEKVKVFQDGFAAWEKAGLPVNR